MDPQSDVTGLAEAMDAPVRQRFLKTAALGMAGASLAPVVWAHGSPDAPPPIPEWMKTPNAATAANPYGLLRAHEVPVVCKLSVVKQAQSVSPRTRPGTALRQWVQHHRLGTLAMDKPVKTSGSYWTYAPTLFD